MSVQNYRRDQMNYLISLAKTCVSCLKNIDMLFVHHRMVLIRFTSDDESCSCLWIVQPSNKSQSRHFKVWSGRQTSNYVADEDWLQDVFLNMRNCYSLVGVDAAIDEKLLAEIQSEPCKHWTWGEPDLHMIDLLYHTKL